MVLSFFNLPVANAFYIRTGGGPPGALPWPGVLFYKRFFYYYFFLKFIFKPKPLFFPDPHQKFIEVHPLSFF